MWFVRTHCASAASASNAESLSGLRYATVGSPDARACACVCERASVCACVCAGVRVCVHVCVQCVTSV